MARSLPTEHGQTYLHLLAILGRDRTRVPTLMQWSLGTALDVRQLKALAGRHQLSTEHRALFVLGMATSVRFLLPFY